MDLSWRDEKIIRPKLKRTRALTQAERRFSANKRLQIPQYSPENNCKFIEGQSKIHLHASKINLWT